VANLSRKSAAGFTLVELVAVLLILSSLTWLFINSFSSAGHSSFQFAQVIQQFIARAHSLSLANTSPGHLPSVRIELDKGQARLALYQGSNLIESYQQGRAFNLAVSDQTVSQYALDWAADGYLLGANRRFVFEEEGNTSSYCLLRTTVWLREFAKQRTSEC